MKYSIIVPVYNREKYIGRCIESVTAQTFQDWELILIDDGSADSSKAICETYAKKNPLQIRVVHQANSGVLKARRTGIAVSKGDYLCFLDSDDIYKETLLECVTPFLTSYDPDILVFGFQKISKNGEILETRLPESSIAYYSGEKMIEIHEKLVTGNLSNLWNQVVKRSVVDFDADYSQVEWVFKGEDLLQNLAFYAGSQSVLLIPECLYSYYDNQSGLTRQKITPSYIRSHIVVLDHLLQYCEKWEINPYETTQLSANVIIRSFKALYRDSFIHPLYSKRERRELLIFLSSGKVYNFVEMIKPSENNKLNFCLRLLKRKKIGTLSRVLYFLHILFIMRNTYCWMLNKKNGVAACQD